MNSLRDFMKKPSRSKKIIVWINNKFNSILHSLELKVLPQGTLKKSLCTYTLTISLEIIS